MPGARVPGAVFRDVDDGELRAGCAGERGGGPQTSLVPPWESFGGQVEAEPIERCGHGHGIRVWCIVDDGDDGIADVVRDESLRDELVVQPREFLVR